MASKDELYISITPEVYKKNKSNLLESQADLLNSLKSIHKLKVLARQKRDLKFNLHKLISSVLYKIDLIQEKMPTPKIPKALIHKEEQEKRIVEETPGRQDMIETELQQIQAKLRELNS